MFSTQKSRLKRFLTRATSVKHFKTSETVSPTKRCVSEPSSKFNQKNPAIEYESIVQEIVCTEYTYLLELRRILNEVIGPLESQTTCKRLKSVCTCLRALHELHTLLYKDMVCQASPISALSKSLPVFSDIYHTYIINMVMDPLSMKQYLNTSNRFNDRLLIPLQHLLRYPMLLGRLYKYCKRYPHLCSNITLLKQTLTSFQKLCTYMDEEKAREESYLLLSFLCRNHQVALDIPRWVIFKGPVPTLPSTEKTAEKNLQKACVFCNDGLLVWTNDVTMQENMKALSIEQCLQVEAANTTLHLQSITLHGQLVNHCLEPNTLAAAAFVRWYKQRQRT
ncbi:rho guanine nucleotide exchange factor [Schizosaccharomyces japonicus yFS275]|uniref:Rho guanine nucleotide exchange factor n=1 Tax=Schizosaccharomyces japonicus (strain yFS275 / FY16936) TaxID=402676 RepID=B6K4N8_SCHJY|nr:rho guanine nucleotide exchange factor [Schizosaccharomyces japonicus yFS275]EEB08445.1 rho guanine nucleotide exchange factor [Schizosaccharomyces japonicus yFS275]